VEQTPESNISVFCRHSGVRKGNSETNLRHAYYIIDECYISVTNCTTAYRFHLILLTDELHSLA